MYIIVKVHIHRPRLMQTRQIFITFRTFIGQTNKRNPTLNLFYGGDRRPPFVISMYGGGFKTREVKVQSPERKSRTRETDELVGTPCSTASHALLILGGVPDLGSAGGREVDDDGRGWSVASPATCTNKHWTAASRMRG